MNKNEKLEFYTAVWCNRDENHFRLRIPLELLGESLLRYGSLLKIKLVVLEGYNKLSSEYLNKLESLGFEILNLENIFSKIVDRFPNLNKHYNHYERNCFLRWIIFKEVIENKPNIEQFWHLDSDVILHTSLEEISRDTRGKTFMLEGCPVLLSISDFNWFKTYETELIKLESDIENYSNHAAKHKTKCLGNDLLLCNQSLYRNPLGSDQDFLEYLVSSRIIKQDEASSIFDSSFYFSQNILVFNLWKNPQFHGKKPDFVTEGVNKELFYGNKKIPFVHFQGTFCDFSMVYIILFKLGLLRFSKLRNIMNFEIIDNNFYTSKIFRFILKSSSLFKFKFSRFKLIKFLMNQNKETGQMHLTELINFINKK